ncbi:MAG: hypothetical protein FWG54_03945 [Bacteroidetes bacterium]|nr:hypothetical protein [Bacteroidota bacterium]
MPSVVQGVMEAPNAYLEVRQELTGSIKGLFTGKPIPNGSVLVLAKDFDFIGEATADSLGRFRMTLPDFPDSTRFLLYGRALRDRRVELSLDADDPLPLADAVFSPLPKRDVQFDQYMSKADQQFTNEYGLRTYDLRAAIVSADKPKDKGSSIYSSTISDRYVPQNLVDQFKTDIIRMLGLFYGTRIEYEQGERIVTGPDGKRLLIVLDNNIMPEWFSINDLQGVPIKRVEVLKEPESFIFGLRLGFGEGSGDELDLNKKIRDVLLITTDQDAEPDQAHSFHLLTTMPKGYKKSVEFYSPKYETQEQRANPKPDLRTTIFWKPDVQLTEEGTAHIEFYSADSNSAYTIQLEGITSDGVVIRQTAQMPSRSPLPTGALPYPDRQSR